MAEKQVKGNLRLVEHDLGDTAIMFEDHQLETVPDNYKPVPQIWHRWVNEGESIKAYSYFKMFLHQDGTTRSIARAARRLRMNRHSLNGYSSKFQWFNRAEAYDNYVTGKVIEQKRIKNEALEMEWIERRNMQRQAEWKLSQTLLDKVREMLSVPLIRQIVEKEFTEMGEDGVKIVHQTIIYEPLDWKPADMGRFFEIAVKVARLATGMDTDHKKLTIDVSALTDEELERIANSK